MSDNWEQQQKWQMSSENVVRNKSTVRNPTLLQQQQITRASTSTQNLSQLYNQPTKPNVTPTKHYLTVSSEETASTFTELDGEDLVDIDYISDYSVDLSNDDDDENFEDIQAELYLRNLLYTIDRLTFDDLSTVEKQNNHSTSFSLIELPKNLVAECHVWRQKFRFKRITPLHRSPQHPTIFETRQRYRRTSTETSAIINQVIDWSGENSLLSSFPKLTTSTSSSSSSSVRADTTTTGASASSNLEKPTLVKAEIRKGVSGGWMQQQQQPSASSISRITLPPIVSHHRLPQSTEQQEQTPLNSITGSVSHMTTAILNKPNFELKPKDTESRYSTIISRQQQQQQSLQQQQHQQRQLSYHHHPLQTSKSLTEEQQLHQYEEQEHDAPKTATQSGSNTSGINNRASASSSYSRLTLHDLLDQRDEQQQQQLNSSSSNSIGGGSFVAWSQQHHHPLRPSAQLRTPRSTHRQQQQQQQQQQQHLLKLPAIQS